jgi:hypothetical protein
MNHLTSITLAEMRRHELRADAARVRLAAEARRRRRHVFVDWRERIAGRRRGRRTVMAPALANVVRERAFGLLVGEPTSPVHSSAREGSGRSDAA